MHPLLLALLPVSMIPFLTHYYAHLCPLISRSTPIIQISTGSIQGRVGYSLRSGKPFWQFLSIPYAEAPVGKLRFQPPVPLKESWDGVKQTVVYPPMCLHYESIGMQVVQGREDCLFLNVFVSSPSKIFQDSIAESKRPVFVYIYGGAFQCGSTRLYYPDFFMEQDEIVLVTFDYRLGPLGFLNLAEAGDYSEENMRLPRGNMGLKDQRLLLQWVQTNIANFGGDPQRVTIFGESAGGASTHFHMTSPKSQGLFHKAISFSASALNPWAFAKGPEYQKRISSRYASFAGCLLDDKIKLWECLSTADFSEVVKQQHIIENPSGVDDLLLPSIEVVNSDDIFFDRHPREILEAGGGSKVPLILGVNSGDGSVFTARIDGRPERTKRLKENWVRQVAFNLGVSAENVSNACSEKIREFYFKNVNFSFTNPTQQEVILKHATKYISDSYFYRDVHKAAVQHTVNGSPTFLYFYNYTAKLAPSQYSYFRAVNPNEWIPPKIKIGLVIAFDWLVERMFGPEKGPRRFGITHSEELLQIFNLIGILGYTSGPDEEFSNALLKTIVDFGRRDEKFSRSPLSFRGVKWPALRKADVTGSNSSYLVKPLPTMLMDNNDRPRLIWEPYTDSLEFWAQLKKEETCTSGMQEHRYKKNNFLFTRLEQFKETRA